MLSSLTCEADGATSFIWERQSGSIPSGAIGVNTNTLTIINLQPEDAGNYRCVAINGDRSSKSNYATLSINGNIHNVCPAFCSCGIGSCVIAQGIRSDGLRAITSQRFSC